MPGIAPNQRPKNNGNTTSSDKVKGEERSRSQEELVVDHGARGYTAVRKYSCFSS